jgi:hypothetical protein
VADESSRAFDEFGGFVGLVLDRVAAGQIERPGAGFRLDRW